MTCSDRQKLIEAIVGKCGMRMMLTVDAALRVASNKWTDDDTRRFGSIVRDILKGKEPCT